MRRIGLALSLVLCLMITDARAVQMYTHGEPPRCYTCMDFEAEVPDDVAEIFSSLMCTGDEVICGSRGQGEWSQDSILMAVRRDGKVLLMIACCNDDGIWETCLETDSFIPMDFEFDITYLPEEDDGENWGIQANHAIVC